MSWILDINTVDTEVIGAPFLNKEDHSNPRAKYCTRAKCGSGKHNCERSESSNESSQITKRRRITDEEEVTERLSDPEKLARIGSLFTSAYGVIKSVLQYLTWSELETAAQVCTDWKEIANVIFAERHDPFWFYLEYELKNKGRSMVSFVPKEPNSRPFLCIVLMNHKATEATHCRLLPADACATYCDQSHRYLQYMTKKFSKSDILALCATAISCSFNPIGIKNNSWASKQLLPHHPQINGICIPNIPNVKISKFIIKKDSNFSDIFQKNIGKDHHLKCLLAFISYGRFDILDQTKVLQEFFNTISDYQGNVPFAFGGGSIKSIKQSNYEKAFKRYENDISCITFSKLKDSNYDFNASSVILWENAIDSEDIESIFEHLWRKTTYRKHMAAFRFACISRKSQSCLEVKCFHKFFPNVNMIGFEGLGEFGFYVISDDSEVPVCTNRDFAHSNTTIVVLLSWGPAVKSPFENDSDDESAE